MSDKPAIGLIELASIARGFRVVDGMIKQAVVDVLYADQVSGGKFAVLVGGDVADVQEAFALGKELADEQLAGSVFLPRVHGQIRPALAGEFGTFERDSLGIIECRTIAATVISCDAALKAAEVTLIALRLHKRLGGKGYFAFVGALDQVEAAVETAVETAEQALVVSEIIPRPHDEAWDLLFGGERLTSSRAQHRLLAPQ